MTLFLTFAFLFPVCPGGSPADTYPVTLFAGCPAPATGLLYPLDHEDSDVRLKAAATGAQRAAEACAAKLDEYAEADTPTWALVAGALVIGVGLGYYAD